MYVYVHTILGTAISVPGVYSIPQALGIFPVFLMQQVICICS
jgi:hypothetical protein